MKFKRAAIALRKKSLLIKIKSQRRRKPSQKRYILLLKKIIRFPKQNKLVLSLKK